MSGRHFRTMRRSRGCGGRRMPSLALSLDEAVWVSLVDWIRRRQTSWSIRPKSRLIVLASLSPCWGWGQSFQTGCGSGWSIFPQCIRVDSSRLKHLRRRCIMRRGRTRTM
uniref:Uncharacterized protein n=1 Tax=Arundo donax TaxID=35708 RepID=A0A0A9FCF5_ARUDO